MKLLALLNPRSWFSSGQRGPLSSLQQTSSLGGVPLGSVKALPETLGRRFFSFENQRTLNRNLIQGELQLPAVTPLRNDLVEDDADARGWLDGDGPRTLLEANDRWQRK
jgi:hypothetical protein